MDLPTLESLDVKNKTVLVRLDLNVPMHAGRITDDTRLKRTMPTLQHLIEQHAKVVILSHLGRPDGKVDLSQSLAPLVDVISEALWDRPVRFSPDCVGRTAQLAVENMAYGEVILMENLRFHSGEEGNDLEFARELASLGDLFVNDAFSCSHRAHASIVGINHYLPSAAGRLMAEEVIALESIFTNPKRPLAAVVGGSKVSTKIELLDNLAAKVDMLVIGGAMANTFLYAMGHDVGKSLCETSMKDTVHRILAAAKKAGCEVLLPTDAVVANKFAAHAASQIVPITAIPSDAMMLDIGPESVMELSQKLSHCQTIVWNGPIGAFEVSPFDVSTVSLARLVANLTRQGKVHSVAGGGDTVSALTHSGLASEFSYLSTAGGAFLEWLEGKALPGVVALTEAPSNAARARA